MPSSLAKRLLDGAFFSFLCFVVSTLFNLVVNTVCARSAGVSGFGGYGIILETVTFGVALASLGAYDTAVQFVSHFRATAPEKVGGFVVSLAALVFGSTSVVALAAAVLADPIATRVLDAPHLALPLRIGSANFVLLSLFNVLSGSLQGLEAFRTITVATLLANLAATPAWIALGLAFGLDGWIAGAVLQAGVLCAFLGIGFGHVCRERGYRLGWIGLDPAIRGVREHGMALQVQHLAQEGGAWLLRVMIAQQPTGLAALGLLRAGRTLLSFGPLLQKILGYASLPVITETLASGAVDRAERTVVYNLRILCLPSIAVTVGVFACLPEILRLWLGAEYIPAWPVTIALGLAVLVMLAGQICRQPLVAARLGWRMAWIPLASVLVLLGSFTLGLDRLGVVGFGLSMLAAELFQTTGFVLAARRWLGLHLGGAYLRILVLIAASSAPGALSAAYVPGAWSLVAGSILAASVFAGGLFFLFRGEERRLLASSLLGFFAQSPIGRRLAALRSPPEPSRAP